MGAWLDWYTERSPMFPAGLVLRRTGRNCGDAADGVAAGGPLHTELFGRHDAAHDHAVLNARRTRPEHTQLWLIEYRGEAVCGGRLEVQGRWPVCVVASVRVTTGLGGIAKACWLRPTVAKMPSGFAVSRLSGAKSPSERRSGTR